MPSGKLKGCGIGSGKIQIFFNEYTVKGLQFMYDESGIDMLVALYEQENEYAPSSDSILRVLKSMGVIPRKQGESLNKLNKDKT